jgi:hypothetical protein
MGNGLAVVKLYGISHAVEYKVFNIRCIYINVGFRDLSEQWMLKRDESYMPRRVFGPKMEKQEPGEIFV